MRRRRLFVYRHPSDNSFASGAAGERTSQKFDFEPMLYYLCMRTHNKFGNHEKIHSNTLAPCRLRFGAGPVSYTHLDVYKRQDVQRGVDGADERRFSDARIARNEGRTPFEQLVYRTDAFARGGGDLHDTVSGAFVHGMKVCDGLRVLQVDFREQDRNCLLYTSRCV